MKKTNVSTEVKPPELQFIDMADVYPSNLNPRKTINQDELSELTESIRKVGLIQAITVRPKKNNKGDKMGYEIVCGERRFSACFNAGMTQIPASIRELTDEEALELMVTENLQRKDVHPFEEAQAFSFMLKHMNYEVEDVAAKIGKPTSFVHRRLSLLHLIPLLEDKLKSGDLPVGHAELLARVEIDVQGEWYTEAFEKRWNGPSAGTHADLKHWLKRNAEHLLSDAKFNTASAIEVTNGEIIAACSACPKNTAYMSLFPGEDAKCLDRVCWAKKTNYAYEVALEEAKKDPDIHFVNYSYQQSPALAKIKKDGFPVLDYYGVNKLMEPTFDAARVYREDFDTEEEYQEELHSQQADYQSAINEYQEKLKSAVKCFDLASGGFINVTLSRGAKPEKQTPGTKQKEAISDQKAKLIRGRELDDEKIMTKILELLPEHMPEGKLTKVEKLCLYGYIYQQKDWNDERTNEDLGIDAYEMDDEQKIERIQSAPDAVLARMVRRVILKKFHSIFKKTITGDLLYRLAKEWIPEQLTRIELDQESIRDRREERINAKIKQLEKEQNTGQ